MKLRVLMATAYPRHTVRGGVEAAAHQLVSALAQRDDLEVHVAAFHPTVSRPFDEVCDGIHLHWVRRWRRLSTFQLLTVGALQLLMLERHVQPDVLHAQGPTPFGVSARFSRRPLVLTVHGLEMLSTRMRRARVFSGPVGVLRRRLAGLAMDLSVERCDAVVSISPYVEQFLGDRLADKPRAAIANPVAPAFFDVPQASNARGGCLLSVGNLSETKNQLLLVRAFAAVASNFPTWRLVLVGPTTDHGYRARVEKLITSLGLSGRVQLSGETSPDDVVELYARADVVLSGSIQETAPLAVAQAMAAARPVVATDVGGLRWMVEDRVTGFIVPSDGDAAMASALRTLLGDAQQRQDMGQAARRVALERFHPRQIAEQTADFYRQVVGNACAS
jgi:glycosyltransferase involved in cell wall biosynthesis